MTAPSSRTAEQALLSRFVRVLIALALCALAFTPAVTVSRGQGFGGSDFTGSEPTYIDWQGNPVDTPPPFVMLLLRPSASFFVVAIAVVLVGAIIAWRRGTAAGADSALRATVMWLVGLTVVAIVSAQMSFWLIPIRPDMENGERIPVPFGYAEVTVDEMIVEW